MANALFENLLNGSTPKLSLAKLGLFPKQRPIRIMVVGQKGVGKTALVVRLITRRFIGEYDSKNGHVYNYSSVIDKEVVVMEIIDSPCIRNTNGGVSDADMNALEKNIHGADAFILMYSVTDKCSFDDCNRLRFLINYNNKRRRKSIINMVNGDKDTGMDIPVILVGNKKDQKHGRMVGVTEGQKRYREMSCTGFHEISVRESMDEVWSVFQDLCRSWRLYTKNPKLKRSTSDAQTFSYSMSPDTAGAGYFDNYLRIEKRRSFLGFRSQASQQHVHGDLAQSNTVQRQENTNKTGRKTQITHLVQNTPFRERASTDGKILSRPNLIKWGYFQMPLKPNRRMSISLQGHNES